MFLVTIVSNSISSILYSVLLKILENSFSLIIDFPNSSAYFVSQELLFFEKSLSK